MRLFVHTSDIRQAFSNALSEMYAEEVPLYKELIEVVKQVNRTFISAHPELGLTEEDVQHLSVERHGAIRLGQDAEMKNMARFFAVMGMHPVNFYDLTDAGAKSQPVISTAFRAIDLAEIEISPFRVFTSLLRPDDQRFFSNGVEREKIKDTLRGRQIFSTLLLDLITKAEQQGGLEREDADTLIAQGVEVFKWHEQATDKPLYDELMKEREYTAPDGSIFKKNMAIAADICCFPNPHLNHLTPSTLDIDAVQARMTELLAGDLAHLEGKMKNHIEGPPRREALILLRQTAYKALTEAVVFSRTEEGTHTARFGEIEQRGVALTLKGRTRYDAALAQLEGIRDQGREPTAQEIDHAYKDLPDDYDALRTQELANFTYQLTGKERGRELPNDIEGLVAEGYVRAVPIRYEDFLPVSAAGIFGANIGGAKEGVPDFGPSPYRKVDLERIMGKAILESVELAAVQEARSVQGIFNMLGIHPENRVKMRIVALLDNDPAASIGGGGGARR